MPHYHIHLAIFFGLAFITAAVVYLYLVLRKNNENPHRIAGLVMLAIILVNSVLYFVFYGLNYTRLNEIHRVPYHSMHFEKAPEKSPDEEEMQPDNPAGLN